MLISRSLIFLLLQLILTASAQETQQVQGKVNLFPLKDVRLQAGPFLDAQNTNLRYLLALDPDKLLAPFRREAGLPLLKNSYGNWESSGLDGHMGGHYLSALAMMLAATGDAEIAARLHYFIAELKKCQEKNGNGYLGGIPGGDTAWQEIAKGKVQADNFSVNGKWVPWYNLHKTFAGLRDVWRYTANQDALQMWIKFSDWSLALTDHLSEAQMQTMLKSEHGGLNEIFADLAEITGEPKYLRLAQRFSHQLLLQSLLRKTDQLTGLHANTQIPKVIGFQRIAEVNGEQSWRDAAQFFWQTVHDHRSVAIGGNSVKEHFHDAQDFSSMLNEVEGPETCNTYNMLKLTALLFQDENRDDAKTKYSDYYERALYNHILSSQRPETGGFVYFTPMRANHYRVYSQVDTAMWCCVGSGLESQAKYGEFIYARRADHLYVNLFVNSTLNWREQGVQISQNTQFPDREKSTITIHNDKRFSVHLRYPSWVAAGKLEIRINQKIIHHQAQPGSYVALLRNWRKGDQIQIRLPMRTQLEAMPGKSNYYAVLHGPIVLAAKTSLFENESLNFLADDSRMGHIASGPVCPQELAPMFVIDEKNRKHLAQGFKAVAGKSLTFTAPGLIQGKDAEKLVLIPFFRLHDSRYMLYWPTTDSAQLGALQSLLAGAEAERSATDAITIDQVAPGEQQPESDHGFKAEGADTGINQGKRWRHATGWFSYVLNDKLKEAKTLRLSFSKQDAGRTFELVINEQWRQVVAINPNAESDVYTQDFILPQDLVQASGGTLLIKFVAPPDGIAGSLYGVRLLR